MQRKKERKQDMAKKIPKGNIFARRKAAARKLE